MLTPEQSKPSRKIAFYYPYFAGGGAEAVGLWMMEALKEDYEITLFTSIPPNYQQLNLMYGVDLSPELIKTHTTFADSIKDWISKLIANNGNFKKFVRHYVLRDCKKYSSDYDLVISGYNAADLSKPGIQYIHFLKVIEGNDKDWVDRACRWVSNFNQDQLKQNISLVNSEHVANQVKNSYGIESRVVYPPVVLKTSEKPWHEKEDIFICSGRLVKEKSPHLAIKILKEVREAGFDVKLYLTGGTSEVYASEYRQFLDNLIKENQDWITLYENLEYAKYIEVLQECKYGIHMKPESFGISIAEMVKAGAIPFVKHRGGQIEVVGKENTELFFHKPPEAVAKILQVLKNPQLQESLVERMKIQQNLFSVENFKQEVREVVNNYFASIN